MRHSSFYDSKRNKEKLPNKRTTRKERGSSFGPNALFFLLLFSFSVFRPFIVNKFLVIHHVFNVFFFLSHTPPFFFQIHIYVRTFFFLGKGLSVFASLRSVLLSYHTSSFCVFDLFVPCLLFFFSSTSRSHLVSLFFFLVVAECELPVFFLFVCLFDFFLVSLSRACFTFVSFSNQEIERGCTNEAVIRAQCCLHVFRISRGPIVSASAWTDFFLTIKVMYLLTQTAKPMNNNKRKKMW